MSTSLRANLFPLDPGDPLPPQHDRLPAAKCLIDELYRSERAGLVGFIARSSSVDAANDVVQRVFARIAALGSDHVRSILQPRAYLREAARNIVRDDARSASRRLAITTIIDAPDHPVSNPVAVLEARDRLARIERAVQRMKPLTRQIFLARRLDGYSYAEIAEQTGLSERGVEKQMTRAIRQLGRHLHPDG
jgi:RNA polymerase sigma factor (sigma-70 family)